MGRSHSVDVVRRRKPRREESVAGYAAEARYWWLASLLLGPLLGVVGALLVRSGVIGTYCDPPVMYQLTVRLD